MENMDHKTDITKLWITIKGIDGRAKRTAENEAISFNGISFSSSKQLPAKFNKQFNTSKLGRHSFSTETRLVTRETKRKPMEMAETFPNCQIPAIWKSSLIIPIRKPGKDTSQGSSYRPCRESPGAPDSSHDQQISPTCT